MPHWYKDFSYYSVPDFLSFEMKVIFSKNIKTAFVFLALQEKNLYSVADFRAEHPISVSSSTDTVTWDMKMFKESGLQYFSRIYIIFGMDSDSSYVILAVELKNLRGIYLNKTIIYDSFSGLTNISPQGVPNNFVLYQNYPNPFNPSTKIRYSIPVESGPVTLKVYDLFGREVAVLVDNEQKPAGVYEATFDASKLASGVYTYRLQSSSFIVSKKMVLMK
jgi:hypothetical protein